MNPVSQVIAEIERAQDSRNMKTLGALLMNTQEKPKQVHDFDCFKRDFYEGDGGWIDGRLGQAWDLISSVLDEGGQRGPHLLLDEIEELDTLLREKVSS